jgi:hypothetical protein
MGNSRRHDLLPFWRFADDFLLRQYAASFEIAGDIRKYFNGHLYYVHAEPAAIFTIEIVMNITVGVEGVFLTPSHSITLTFQVLIINSASVAVRYPPFKFIKRYGCTVLDLSLY